MANQVEMQNEHFKTALIRAGLTVEEFAQIISVDPKTVQRWVAGRTPYARHRGTVSRALDVPEHELWPDTLAAPKPLAGADNSTAQIGATVRAWPYSDRGGAPNPVALLVSGGQEIDLLDQSGALLLQPGVAAALQKLTADGSQVRVITGQLLPGQELPPALEPIGLRGVDRLSPNPVVLRVDDTMLLAFSLHDGHGPPVFALERHEVGEVFDRFASFIDRLWATATPISSPAAPAPPADPDAPSGRADASEPPRRWPRPSN